MRLMTSKAYIAIELVVLTLLVPVTIQQLHIVRYMLPMLWVISFYCATIHRLTTGERVRDAWRRSAVNRTNLKPILRYFALCALFLGVATLILVPQRLFSLPLQNPAFWLLIMFAYPLLSVIPQEIIFRLFFMERYKHIFNRREMMILASGLAFGLAHLIFQNWVAPLLTAVGGVLFALTYSRHKSLALVSLEHALFGDFLFTVGLGFYFYHGSVAAIAQAAH